MEVQFPAGKSVHISPGAHLAFIGAGTLILRINWSWLEVGHLPPSNEKDTYAWSFTSTLSCLQGMLN
jgi:hypothetical protein